MINENSNSYKPILYNVNIEKNYEQFFRRSNGYDVGFVRNTITMIVVAKE